MADDPGLAALCLPDCPMSNPAAPSSSCSLCSMQGFYSLLCIQLASRLPAGLHLSESGLHYNKSGCSRFPASPASARTGSWQGHKNTKGSSTSAQPARKTCGAWFQIPGGQLTLLQEEPRCHQAGPQQHLLREVYLPNSPKPLSALRLSGSPCLRDIQGYHY